MTDKINDGTFIEQWECVACGLLPCRIEIQYTNDKMPEHLKERNRLVRKECLCNNHPAPEWRKVK